MAFRFARPLLLVSAMHSWRSLSPTASTAQSFAKRTLLTIAPFALAALSPSDSAARLPPITASVARVMLPDDANPGGNVHGGTILKMIDQAGYIAATRYCNQNNPAEPLQAMLARLEKCEFHEPMHIGELAQIEASVSYVAPHSMEVTIEVHALNVITGKRRRTNSARAWYVAKPAGVRGGKVASLTPMVYEPTALEEQGHVRYERQRRQRQGDDAVQGVVSQCEAVRKDMMRLHLTTDAVGVVGESHGHTVADAASSLVQLMLPSDCTDGGVVQAGTIMKLMDNVSGIVAVKHCRRHVVTVSVDAMDFHNTVYNGSVLSFYAWPTFTSERSVEIAVAVFAESLSTPQPVLCNSSHFTFVSLDSKTHKVAPVPQLELTNDDEHKRFEEGKARYLEAKRARPARDASASAAGAGAGAGAGGAPSTPKSAL